MEKTVIDRAVRTVYREFLAEPIPEKMLSGELHEGDTIAVSKIPNKDELQFK